ncbi:hypothetical protein ABZ622_14740 [Streptomyces sp. NPDC007164]|uniref:hypothetical protein n=1 Tax=Streptomyces sp. NPDC007164 TaxID=3156918 RepID=UPI003406B7F6
MLAITVGVIIAGYGVCLSANLWNLADRLFSHNSRYLVMGSATPGTFRLVGGGTALVGLFWIATALSEML